MTYRRGEIYHSGWILHKICENTGFHWPVFSCIFDSVLIRENKSHIFSHILSMWKSCREVNLNPWGTLKMQILQKLVAQKLQFLEIFGLCADKCPEASVRISRKENFKSFLGHFQRTSKYLFLDLMIVLCQFSTERFWFSLYEWQSALSFSFSLTLSSPFLA